MMHLVNTPEGANMCCEHADMHPSRSGFEEVHAVVHITEFCSISILNLHHSVWHFFIFEVKLDCKVELSWIPVRVKLICKNTTQPCSGIHTHMLDKCCTAPMHRWHRLFCQSLYLES